MNLRRVVLVWTLGLLCGCQQGESANPLTKVLAGGVQVCGDEEIRQVAFDFAIDAIFDNLEDAPSPYAIAFYAGGGNGPPPYNEQIAIELINDQVRLLAFDRELHKTVCSLPLKFELHDGSAADAEIRFWAQVNATKDDWIVGLEGLSTPHDLLVHDRNAFLLGAAMNPNREPLPSMEAGAPSSPSQEDRRERRVNAPYEAIRREMIEDGYEPTPVAGRANCEDTFYVEVCRRYPEVVDCSGTGRAYCEFNFVNAEGSRLSVITEGKADLTAVLIRPPD